MYKTALKCTKLSGADGLWNRLNKRRKKLISSTLETELDYSIELGIKGKLRFFLKDCLRELK